MYYVTLRIPSLYINLSTYLSYPPSSAITVSSSIRFPLISATPTAHACFQGEAYRSVHPAAHRTRESRRGGSWRHWLSGNNSGLRTRAQRQEVCTLLNCVAISQARSDTPCPAIQYPLAHSKPR